MKLNMNSFVLNENAFDFENAEYIPCEGTIIPLRINHIEGMKEYLHGKKKIKMAYIYLTDPDNEAMFCIKHTNEDIEVILSPSFKLETDELQSLYMIH